MKHVSQKELEVYLKKIDLRLPDKSPQNIEIEKIRIRINPYVWNPLKGKSSKMFIKTLKNYPIGKEATVLDMGTGSGILALLLWKRGLSNIVASDNNSRVLRNAEFNFKENNAKINLIKSDLFLNIGRKFSLILFNAPIYHPLRKNVSRLKNSLWNKNENLCTEFLDKLDKHLKNNGKALLMFSKFADHNPLPKKVLKKYPYRFRVLVKSRGKLSISGILEIKK